MGWLFKKSKTSFERDEKGRVVKVTRTGDKPSGTPVSDSLMAEYYKQHPEERKSAKMKAGAMKLGKKLDNWANNYNKSSKKSGPMFTWSPPPKSSGKGKPPMAMEFFNLGGPVSRSSGKKKSSGGKKYAVVGGKAYPIAGSGKKKKSSGKKKHRYNSSDPFDFPDMGGW